MVGVVLKVLVASLTLAIVIKLGGPDLPLAPTARNAWILVVTPTLIMSLLLGWRANCSVQKSQL
jgi:hypothetical protein